MSFILDALKKSESDRQRQSGPALFEVKVAPPRHALPPWAVAIAVLFAANLAVVAWLLVRHAATPAAAPPARTPARSEATAAPPAAAAMSAPVYPNAPAPSPSTVTPLARGVATVPAQAPGPAEAPAATVAEPTSNPDDFAPAAEPPPSRGLARVTRGTEGGVPLYAQLAATPGTQLPQLRLDLHAYAERAGDRWVLINMHKLHEGDSLEGVHVARITPDGAVLSYQGTQFLLTRE